MPASIHSAVIAPTTTFGISFKEQAVDVPSPNPNRNAVGREIVSHPPVPFYTPVKTEGVALIETYRVH